MGKPLEVAPGVSRQVGTEFESQQLYAVLGQRDAELSCATADLKHPASVVQVGQRDECSDYRFWVRCTIHVVVVGHQVEGLPPATGFLILHRSHRFLAQLTPATPGFREYTRCRTVFSTAPTPMLLFEGSVCSGGRAFPTDLPSFLPGEVNPP